ncbi:hypothetical protein B0T17DRAFT_575167 [Bombardia bombarda]|uniref:DUF1772-domain-containing protein n=1 Tax=Bombardia bombarda TaxID=252184 RepID=A0AA39X9I7_9PEZI|nr:hypothetical protein B0T17DRAFT_575167 [Bombardia bombarda]
MTTSVGLRALAQWAGIVMPTLFVGMTAQESFTVQTYTQHAPPKVVAKQWLHLYQRGPYWVQPMVYSGVISNGYLAWCSAESSSQRSFYIAAGVLIFSILPVTFLIFEPGVNGACKWKAESLLADEGVNILPFNGIPSAERQSAVPEAKSWAEKTGIEELVNTWGRLNNGRWVISLLAAMASGYASFCLV